MPKVFLPLTSWLHAIRTPTGSPCLDHGFGTAQKGLPYSLILRNTFYIIQKANLV
jgi:hypothetical protein